MGLILLDDPGHAGGSDQLNIGSAPNDGTGDTLRVGAAKLKAWAADLNTMLAEVYAAFPRWIQIGAGITYAQLAAAATQNSIQIYTSLPAMICQGVKIKHSVSFGGGGLTGYTLSVGTTGNLTQFADPYDVWQAVGSGVYGPFGPMMEGGDHVAGTAILLTAASVGGNLNAATAGVVDVWALLSSAR